MESAIATPRFTDFGSRRTIVVRVFAVITLIVGLGQVQVSPADAQLFELPDVFLDASVLADCEEPSFDGDFEVEQHDNELEVDTSVGALRSPGLKSRTTDLPAAASTATLDIPETKLGSLKNCIDQPQDLCPWDLGERASTDAHAAAQSGVVIAGHVGNDHLTVADDLGEIAIVADYLAGPADGFGIDGSSGFAIFNRDVDAGASLYCYQDDPDGLMGGYATATVALVPGGNPIYAQVTKPGVLDGDLLVVEQLGRGLLGGPLMYIDDAVAMRLDERIFDEALMASLRQQVETAIENEITNYIQSVDCSETTGISEQDCLSVNYAAVTLVPEIDFRAGMGDNGGIRFNLSGGGLVSINVRLPGWGVDCDIGFNMGNGHSIDIDFLINNSTWNPVDIHEVTVSLGHPTVWSNNGWVCNIGQHVLNPMIDGWNDGMLAPAGDSIEDFFGSDFDDWVDTRIRDAILSLSQSPDTAPYIASVSVEELAVDDYGLMVSLGLRPWSSTWHRIGSGPVDPLLSQRNTTDGSLFDISMMIAPDMFNAGMRHAIDGGTSLSMTQTLTEAQGQDVLNFVVGSTNPNYTTTGWTMDIRHDTAPRMADFGGAQPGIVLDALLIDLNYNGTFVAQYVTMVENVLVTGDLGASWNFATILDMSNSNCTDGFVGLMCEPTVAVKMNADAATFNESNPLSIFVPSSIAGNVIDVAIEMAGVDGLLPSTTLYGELSSIPLTASVIPIAGELAGADRFHLQFDVLPPVSATIQGEIAGETGTVSGDYTTLLIDFEATTQGIDNPIITFTSITGADSFTSSGTSAQSSLYIECFNLPIVPLTQVATVNITGTVASANGPIPVNYNYTEAFNENVLNENDVTSCDDDD